MTVPSAPNSSDVIVIAPDGSVLGDLSGNIVGVNRVPLRMAWALPMKNGPYLIDSFGVISPCGALIADPSGAILGKWTIVSRLMMATPTGGVRADIGGGGRT